MTLFSGLGTSRTFGIGEGGTTRIFSTFFEYPEGTYTPSFTAVVTYGILFEVNACTSFVGCIFVNEFQNLETVTLSGSANLIIPAATPLPPHRSPAALPLFGTGLGLMGFVGWWRKRRTEMGA